MAVPPAPVRVPSYGNFPLVSWQSYLSANDKIDNEVKPGAVHRTFGIYLTAEENPEKPQLEDRLMKVVRGVIA